MGSDEDSTYLIKNAPSDRVEAPSPTDAPVSAPPDRRWRTSAPPPGESLDATWWPDRDLGTAFRQWTSIPPARGDATRSVAIKFMVEHLSVGSVTAVGTGAHSPTQGIEPPDFDAKVHAMVVRLGTAGPNEEAPEHGALLAIGEEALPALRDLFPGRLWFNRWEPHIQPPPGRDVSGLCRTLVAFGDRAVPSAIELLRSPDPEIRYYATLVAGELPHPALVEPLATALFDEDQGVSRTALHALGMFGEHEGIAPLKASLRVLAVATDADQRSRLLAMRAIAVLRDETAVETLIQALDERSVLGEAAWRVLRMLTAQDFGTDDNAWRAWFREHRSKARTEWLIDSLDHQDREIRAIASRDLSRIAQQDFGYQVDLSADERRAIRERFRLWWSTTQSTAGD